MTHQPIPQRLVDIATTLDLDVTDFDDADELASGCHRQIDRLIRMRAMRSCDDELIDLLDLHDAVGDSLEEAMLS